MNTQVTLFVLIQLSPTQMLVMTIWEVCFYAINFALVYTYFRVNDVGGYISLFHCHHLDSILK